MVAMLRVYPNPYAALDADGYPSGAYPHEGSPGSYVGARLEMDGQDPKELGELLRGTARPVTRRFLFEEGVQEVPASPHYLSALRTGELLAADERTAREAGIEKRYEPYMRALAVSKKRASEEYQAQYGRAPGFVNDHPSMRPHPPPKEGDA